MNLRILAALLVLGCVNLVTVRAENDASDATIVEDVDGVDGASDEVFDQGDDATGTQQQPQISEAVFAQMLDLISPDCRAAIQASPEDASGLSDECKVEVQTTLHKLMGGKVRDPNDPVTPEIFQKMLETIPAECRAEIEANPKDVSKISDTCKHSIQSTMTKLIAKAKRAEEFKKSRASAKAYDASTDEPKKHPRRRGKNEPKGSNTTTLLIVIGFVVTAIAGVAGVAYTLSQKQRLEAGKAKPTKKLSKHKKEKDGRRQQAAAAASIN
ncbi:hypothetical protein DYB31_012517 [Aphanomyces astaci]|uniref:Uncharacterized protein n=2 Tax=Aphanomyces astaci TaxID=112090 RepID=A0A397EEM3_APHAT|nr:hypothetical protein DYB31_012517 [Aphanomyces astaci]